MHLFLLLPPSLDGNMTFSFRSCSHRRQPGAQCAGHRLAAERRDPGGAKPAHDRRERAQEGSLRAARLRRAVTDQQR